MQHERRNISMLMDLYEMTMAHGYFTKQDNTDRVAFDVFYRRNPDQGGFAIFAGLEQVVDYLLNLHFDEEDIAYFKSLHLFSDEFLKYLHNFKFTGDVYAFKEGSIIYPNEPILTIVAPLIDAQIAETAVLTMINHQSLIATKANRIMRAADGRIVSDFGARRAHNVDAAVYGARAAYIGGVHGTATVLAGQQFDIPVNGTMAHSWVMYHDSEYEAFKAYAEVYPESSVFLVDTYDVLNSGIPNAIKVAKDVLEPKGHRLKGIRLDSGDLAYLAKHARNMLDDAGMEDCKIMASNSLDEYTITSILSQGGPIDIFGVGERLITSKTDPVFGAVYKIVGIEKQGKWEPRIKVSESVTKITNPGLKNVYRVYSAEGKAIAELLTLPGEKPSTNSPYCYIDPEKPWKELYFENCTFKNMQELVIKDGKQIVKPPTLKEIRAYVQDQLTHEIWEEEQRFENPHSHYLDMSPEYYHMKMDLLNRIGRKK
ncbi:nicotinate phosphoribosyltransferase [uncultured Veillonella sp.]|uniref:nicotinate phosphoribosyltransferase n=1 Tax=uncultured Veillonella sp. TaxID=159268 RepID=UPI0025D194C5|nr:nicotinate phosphoribosyltransferase [uncultured Veillonella sp.]